MNKLLCSRCKKRMAVVFINKLENGKTVSEGLCLKCAQEMNIPGFDDIIKNMGIPMEDLDSVLEQMGEMSPDEMSDLFEQGGAMAMPLMQSLMSSMAGNNAEPEDDLEDGEEEQQLNAQLQNPLMPQPEQPSVPGGQPRRKPDQPRQKYKYLDNFCDNLNEKAAEGRMDPVIGRDREIYRVIQILNRRTKNNPCLIGEPGVGKTAVAEGIAQRIVAGNVPRSLADKVVYRLDLTGLVAGTQFRGQFESRVKGLVDDVKKAGNVLLFIDEVHQLVGAGDAEGSMNAANILKPSLSRGEIQVIGATTFTEYRKNIEKDAALERRFQTVKVGEPTIEEATEVLLGIKKYYEAFHRVSVSDQLARRAVVLAERYINDRFLPDKAIDLLDEACSCAALENKQLEDYDRLYARKLALDAEIELMEKDREIDFELHAHKKAESFRLQQQIEELAPVALNAPVTEVDFAKVIELWTGIPASKIEQSEAAKVGQLEQRLGEKLIGQEEAIGLVSAAVRRSRVRLDVGKRRPASFILVGPTGVGKTHLVKTLSELLFDTVEPLIRLDMSEFMEKHSVSRIIGSPPGYVGYDEAGQLTEKVRRRPYSIVLLDEIEKAHPDVMNVLLQIMDEGHITDAQGRDVSFENVILMMTSNAGSEKREGALGFNRQAGEVAKNKAMDGLKQFLRPEFLARVDEVVVFRPLSEEDYRRICLLLLEELRPALKEHNVLLGVDDEAVALIAKLAFAQKNGARDIRRQLRKLVEDPICLMLSQAPDNPPPLIKAVVKDGAVVLETA
ncbi:MAG: ATP-dependent Clp protease ATP-binding subunit [Angelakisella sp.]